LTIRKCEPIDGIVSSHIIDHQKMWTHWWNCLISVTLLTIRKCEPVDGIVSSHIIDHQKMWTHWWNCLVSHYWPSENVNPLMELSHLSLTLLTIRKCEPVDGIASSHIIDHHWLIIFVFVWQIIFYLFCFVNKNICLLYHTS
jgi:hypothetical protein